MIEKIKVKNFQKHKNTVLRFSEGVNIITGESDQGKSSIIRAIGWALFNRPSGFWFRTWNVPPKEKTSVRVKFDDGVIERRRNNSENAYKAGKLLLKTVKSDVPDEVRIITKVDDRNFQGQHDGYFLIQNSAGEVARKLNEIVGIDVIDKSLKKAASIVSVLASKEKALREQYDEVESSLKKLEFVDELEPLFIGAKKRIEALDECKEKIEILWMLSRDLAEVVTEIEEEEQWLEVEKYYDRVVNKLDDAKEARKKIDELSKLVNELEKMDKWLREEKDKLDKESVEFQWLEEKWGKVLKYSEEKHNVVRSALTMKRLLNEMSKVGKSIDYTEKEIKVMEHKFEKMMREAGVCPLCGSNTGSFTMEKGKKV